MKKNAVIAISALCTLLITGAAAVASIQGSKTIAGRGSYETAQTPSISENNSESQIPYSYIMKLYNGKIGIFRIGEAEPFETLDTDIKDLPQGDIELLTDGIRLQSAAELQRAVEDYTS